jgi:hypothetical protein
MVSADIPKATPRVIRKITPAMMRGCATASNTRCWMSAFSADKNTPQSGTLGIRLVCSMASPSTVMAFPSK